MKDKIKQIMVLFVGLCGCSETTVSNQEMLFGKFMDQRLIDQNQVDQSQGVYKIFWNKWIL
jgi:hypothetical protein